METNEALRPIFIVGNSRSGTTLMSRIIGRHESVFTFDELHFFEELWSPENGPENIVPSKASYLFARLLNIQRNGYLTRGKVEEFLSESSSVLEKLPQPFSPVAVFAAFLKYESERNGKCRPCDQTPQNILYIHEILESFPEARIIHIVRDPRDILLSQKNRWKRPFLSTNIPKKESIRYWLNYHPITISSLWKANLSAAKRYTSDCRVREVRYEDLIANPEGVLSGICQFVNLDYSVTLLQVPRIGSSNAQDSPEILGIDTSKSQNWRRGGLREIEIFWCQLINQSLMVDYDYEFCVTSVSPISMAFSLVVLPMKLALAFPLNLSRVRNIKAAIKRRLSGART